MRTLLGLVFLGALLTVGCDRFQFPGRTAGDEPHYTEQQFDDLINQSPVVLVKFGAPWCGPCRMLDDELPKVTGDLEVVSINVDNNRELSAQYRVSGIPHMILFRDGKKVDTRTGYHSAESISQWAAEHGSTASI